MWVVKRKAAAGSAQRLEEKRGPLVKQGPFHICTQNGCSDGNGVGGPVRGAIMGPNQRQTSY